MPAGAILCCPFTQLHNRLKRVLLSLYVPVRLLLLWLGSEQHLRKLFSIKHSVRRVVLTGLQLKPGMRDIAAFLESRRMAPYVGATSEFSKWEVSFPCFRLTALQLHHSSHTAVGTITDTYVRC